MSCKNGKTVFCRKWWAQLTWLDAATLVVGVLFVVVLVKALPFSIRINTTESLPLGLYVQDHRKSPAVGDLVIVAAPSPVAYQDPTVRALLARNRDLLKPVGALEGAYLSTVGAYVYTCPHENFPDRACTLLGVGAPTDSKGRPLHLWNFNRTKVPAGYAYLGSLRSHPRALDSRYLGLVPIDKSQGTTYPWLTE